MVTVYVYILRCADGSYYVGKYQGDRIEWRVADHNNGVYPNAYTAKRRPVTLVWSTWFGRYDEAVLFERRLKGWSRAKKEALMRGDEAALKSLSKRRSRFHHPEEPERNGGVTRGERTETGARILRDAAEEAAPQDEETICPLTCGEGNISLHPEEPEQRGGVTKDAGTAADAVHPSRRIAARCSSG